MDQLPPDVARYLRQMESKQERVETQLKALYSTFKKQSALLEDKSIELSQLKDTLRKAVSRIKYVEDIPGKRIPYFLNFEVSMPGPDRPTFTLVGTRLQDVKSVSMDGPFVCTTYMAAFRLKTFSLGPIDADTRQSDPPAGTEIITPLTGRFRPIASTADAMSGAFIGPTVGALNVSDTSAGVPDGGAYFTRTFRPGTIDFLWEVADEGVDRNRQNQVLSPSRYLFSEFDRPLYLPIADFFERGSSIKFGCSLTHDLGFAELNFATYATDAGNWIDANIPAASTFSADSETRARMVVGLGGTLTFTMLGYKILQAQSPAT